MIEKGYTLFELLITFTMIAILSTLSFYFYAQYMVKTRRADGELALMKLSSALENYYLEHNTYQGATLNNIHVAEKTPQGFYQLHFDLLQEGQSYAVKATPIGAQAKQDMACGTLVLYTDGRRSYEGSDPKANCW